MNVTTTPALQDKIPLFDLARQRLRLDRDVRARIDAVLAHGQFILGPEVDEFERELEKFSGAHHAIAVSSGRDALMIALMAMAVQAGDAVFMPAFTFAATAGSAVAIGAVPVFVDVDATTFNMDPADLERAIAEVAAAGTLRPRVVMPVDLYGLPADYAAISAIARRHGMDVLADAAQSFGGALGNRRVGTLAPVSAVSFYPTKPLGCYGDGGAVLAEDPKIAEQVRMIRSHGRSGTGDAAMVTGLTGRLDTLQAAVLLAKLSAFSAELDHRDAVAARYSRSLPKAVKVPQVAQNYRSAWALYTIRVANRDGVRAKLDAQGVGTGLFYRLALHQHPAFASFKSRALPVSEQLANEVLSLPMGPDLTDAEIDRVVAAVSDAVRG